MKTLADKLWDRHEILSVDGERLLSVDRLFLHEGSGHAFRGLKQIGKPVRKPAQVVACADHYVPTVNRIAGKEGISDPAIRDMLINLENNVAQHGITYFGMNDPHQGILHVVAPEQGITQPGLLIAGADSHTTTHGAFGCLAFGIGASEALHVLATQTLWLQKPRMMRVNLHGALSPHVSAKDVVLALIGRIGTSGATGFIIEYAGPGAEAMSIEERMTMCNMAVEAGGRAGLVAPDDTTFAYLEGRPYAPKGALWAEALADWRQLFSDTGVRFDAEHTVDLGTVSPFVTWGTSPQHVIAIDQATPDPDTIPDLDDREEIQGALDYMGLHPSQSIVGVPIDHVFIGSCTNARIEDLRMAADIARSGKAKVPAWVVPGSSSVKRQAEAEGLDKIFKAAGFEWRDSGCSLCTAINGEVLGEFTRCASTSNRNFRGRQGRNARTHLLSPAMAAAAALTGVITDVRNL